jgi:hypothetical protein
MNELEWVHKTEYWWQYVNNILIVRFSIERDGEFRLNMNCNCFTWYIQVCCLEDAGNMRVVTTEWLDCLVDNQIEVLNSFVQLMWQTLRARGRKMDESMRGRCEKSIVELWKSEEYSSSIKRAVYQKETTEKFISTVNNWFNIPILNNTIQHNEWSSNMTAICAKAFNWMREQQFLWLRVLWMFESSPGEEENIWF